MKAFKVEAVVSGISDIPETCVERIIAEDWQEALDVLSRMCHETNHALLSVTLTEAAEGLFGCKTAARPPRHTA